MLGYGYAMRNLVYFILATLVLLWLSRKALQRPGSHGFYRFFAAECIVGLYLLSRGAWLADPLAPRQVACGVLLLASAALPLYAARLLRAHGRPDPARQDPALYGFEKTSTLVQAGVYRYIRHPMYAALLLLAWGIFLKQFSWAGLALVLAATALLVMTARADERECLAWFGGGYRDYMQRTKRFIPFVF